MLKFHQNDNFDFLTACLEIKFDELSPKQLILFFSIEYFYPIKLYIWWHLAR